MSWQTFKDGLRLTRASKVNLSASFLPVTKDVINGFQIYGLLNLMGTLKTEHLETSSVISNSYNRAHKTLTYETQLERPNCMSDLGKQKAMLSSERNLVLKDRTATFLIKG